MGAMLATAVERAEAIATDLANILRITQDEI
jgi:hypothetical protein